VSSESAVAKAMADKEGKGFLAESRKTKAKSERKVENKST